MAETSSSARAASAEMKAPALPEGMSLDAVLERAARPPPDSFPRTIMDDRFLMYLLADQLEARLADDGGDQVLGWEGDLWMGWDYDKIWVKLEGEAGFGDATSVESETDLLYSRLISPFWYLQAGLQYANGASSESEYSDRWSAAVALQGMAPGKFEIDLSLYLSDDADVTGSLEVEYDWRLTQRLVLQPRGELSFAFQDVDARNLGVGPTDLSAGLRLRYALLRELAPYVGVRYETKLFGTVDRTRDAGEALWRVLGVAGLRFALL